MEKIYYLVRYGKTHKEGVYLCTDSDIRFGSTAKWNIRQKEAKRFGTREAAEKVAAKFNNLVRLVKMTEKPKKLGYNQGYIQALKDIAGDVSNMYHWPHSGLSYNDAVTMLRTTIQERLASLTTRLDPISSPDLGDNEED